MLDTGILFTHYKAEVVSPDLLDAVPAQPAFWGPWGGHPSLDLGKLYSHLPLPFLSGNNM